MVRRNQPPTQESAHRKRHYEIGTLIVAFSFLVSGISGIISSETALTDFNKCYYVILNRLLGGTDLNPSA